jgi:hypothetical protein
VTTTAAPARDAASNETRASVIVAVVADAGALPQVAPGLSLAAALDVGRFRVVALGALFATAEARLAAGGGDFRLAFGGALGCWRRPVGHATGAVCAGAEVGALSGQGTGVSNSKLGTALWLAPRAELDLAIPLVARVRLALAAGAAAPVSRPSFVETVGGETVRVHRAAPVAARATAGIEVGF